MKAARISHHEAGMTLVELVMGAAVSSAIGLAVFAFLNAGMYLSARNVSLNMTSTQMRGALDRVEQVLQQGASEPVLIDTSGNSATGPAAGVKFDRTIDGPYIADLTTTVAGSTNIKITRSASSLMSVPPDSMSGMIGDVILLDGAAATVRPRISTAPTASGTTLVTYACPLAAALSSTIKPVSGDYLTAKRVRQVALLVMTNGSKRELRYYHSFETASSLSDSSKYSVITDQIGTAAADVLPFSIQSIGSQNFVSFSLRVRSSAYDTRLQNKQSDEFNTFSRVDSYARPKGSL